MRVTGGGIRHLLARCVGAQTNKPLTGYSLNMTTSRARILSGASGALFTATLANLGVVSMPAKITAHAAQTTGILPDALYPRAAFVRASGISRTRLREARLMGLPLPVMRVGKRQFVLGRDAIEWIIELAELSAEKAESERAAV